MGERRRSQLEAAELHVEDAEADAEVAREDLRAAEADVARLRAEAAAGGGKVPNQRLPSTPALERGRCLSHIGCCGCVLPFLGDAAVRPISHAIPGAVRAFRVH
jgi:hypothetical protein